VRTIIPQSTLLTLLSLYFHGLMMLVWTRGAGERHVQLLQDGVTDNLPNQPILKRVMNTESPAIPGVNWLQSEGESPLLPLFQNRACGFPPVAS